MIALITVGVVIAAIVLGCYIGIRSYNRDQRQAEIYRQWKQDDWCARYIRACQESGHDATPIIEKVDKYNTMTVRTNEIAITQAELAVILNDLALVNSERLSLDVAADMILCVMDLRDRASTGKLTAKETRILRG